MKQICSFAIAALMVSASAQADVLLIDSMNADVVSVPANGITKAEVANRFGDPQQRIAPVGEPPISSWAYPGFDVYFEYDRVLHSVVNR